MILLLFGVCWVFVCYFAFLFAVWLGLGVVCLLGLVVVVTFIAPLDVFVGLIDLLFVCYLVSC